MMKKLIRGKKNIGIVAVVIMKQVEIQNQYTNIALTVAQKWIKK
jgi:hypothetical protein